MTYNITILGTPLNFACKENQNILDAALKAGIEMPYSCRKGVCGNCAGVVFSGDVECPPTGEATPIGKHLFCQCHPKSDLEIVPEAWHLADPNARKSFDVKVYRNIQAADDVNVLMLRLPTGQRARFKAGQYLKISLPDGSRRSYSMANPPHESDMLQLHIRHVTGGQFTQKLPNLKAGDLMHIELPFGSFELKQDTQTPILCVVGGTGFAPVKSLLDDILKKNIKRSVTLIWGSRDRTGLYLMSAIEKWKKMLPSFNFVAAVEDQFDAEALSGFHGRVDEAVCANYPTLVGYEVYCCGSPGMVASVKKVCVERCGLDSIHFFSDVFVPGPVA
jgi:CDP-4-dehydro-6-deoxyglucose reductase/terephthalate 1,2-dioxygenase reductase component